MRIFTDGAEAGDSQFFDNASAVAMISGGRSGQYSYNAGSQPYKTIPQNLTEFYLRFGWYNQGFGNNWFVYWRNLTGSTFTILGGLYFDNTSQKVLPLVGTGAAQAGLFGNTVFVTNVWYLIEVHVKLSSGTDGIIQTKVDGVVDSTFNGKTLPGTTVLPANNFWWQRLSNTTAIDDLALNDTTGSVDNSWCGDGHVIAMLPNGNGDANQWLGSDGNSVDNYALVNERAPNTTTYVDGTVVDTKDLYRVGYPTGQAAIDASVHTIKRVWAETRALNSVAAGGSMAIVLKTNNQEYESPTVGNPLMTSIVLTTAYKQYRSDEYPTNPQTGNVWNTTELANLQVGVKVK